MLAQQEYSLISPEPIGQRGNRSLLLLFLVSEIVESYKAFKADKWDLILTPHPRFFPYDWGYKIGHLNKLKEHSFLLKKNFPEKMRYVKTTEKTISKSIESLLQKTPPSDLVFLTALQRIYSSLEPLITLCKEDENLIFFLLKHQATIDALIEKGHLRHFILKIHPCGLEVLGEKMCDRYHRRGFFSQIPEFKLLLTELIHAS